jgi:hypothetical protein
VNHFLGIATFAKNFRTFVGVLFSRVVGGIGPALVIEIVEKAGESPEIFVGFELSGIGAGAGFHGESVFSKAFALRVFAEKVPGVVSCRHHFLDTMLLISVTKSNSVSILFDK